MDLQDSETNITVGNISGLTLAEEDNFYNISTEVYRYYVYHGLQRHLRSILTPILCLLGCVGNIINLLVLTKIRDRKANGGKERGAHLGLTCLAVSDMCFCVTVFPRGFVPSTTSLFEKQGLKLFYQAYGTGLVTTFILTSTWLTVAMTAIRYVAICYPFSARKMTGYISSKTCYILIFILCFLFNIPSYFQYRITLIDIEGDMHYLIDIGYFNDGTTHGRVFVWAKAVLGIFLPALLMAFFNLSLIAALRRSYQMRQECSRNARKSTTHSNRITLTLIMIVISFVILVFPSEIMDFFSDFIKMDVTKTEVFLVTRSFANAFQVVNFACNFVLYCAINVHFRDVLWELITLNGRISCGLAKWKSSRDARMKRHSLHTSSTQIHRKSSHGMEMRPLQDNVDVYQNSEGL